MDARQLSIEKKEKEMSDVKKAIENITYFSKKYPEEDFRVISEHPREVLPYLRDAVDYAVSKGADLEDGYELYFYALFFLGQFKDTESFERIIALLSLPAEVVDGLLGDVLAEGLGDILYHTYNGNLPLLKDSIRNRKIQVYARLAMLDVMGQIYLDGALDKEEWLCFLKRVLADSEEDDYELLTLLPSIICECHLIEMLPDIQTLYREDLIDEWLYGDFDSCVDMMFDYEYYGKRLCKPSISVESLRCWAMFQEDEEEREESEEKWDKVFREYEEECEKASGSRKIGRNDSCPCGSGKKYKHCCLVKDRGQVESLREQRRWLKSYPKLGEERVEGRIYLEDYFDSESIEIDKQIYLALHHRAIPVWEERKQDQSAIDARNRAYLWNAFCKFEEKMQEEELKTAAEYDEKFGIHYECRDWLGRLLGLLEENGEEEKCAAVAAYID